MLGEEHLWVVLALAASAVEWSPVSICMMVKGFRSFPLPVLLAKVHLHNADHMQL